LVPVDPHRHYPIIDPVAPDRFLALQEQQAPVYPLARVCRGRDHRPPEGGVNALTPAEDRRELQEQGKVDNLIVTRGVPAVNHATPVRPLPHLAGAKEIIARVVQEAKQRQKLTPVAQADQRIVAMTPASPAANVCAVEPPTADQAQSALGMDSVARDPLLRAVRLYRSLGYGLARIAPDCKQPRDKGWSLRSREIEHFQAGDMVGILGGALSKRLVTVAGGTTLAYLVIVDLDCPEALERADQFLPVTSMSSGRPGRPRSHRFYLVTNVPPKLTSTAVGGAGGPCILHHAGLDVLGTGGQAVQPPSTWHGANDMVEQREWYDAQGNVVDEPGDPVVVDCAELYKKVGELVRSYGGRVSGQKRGPRAACGSEERKYLPGLPSMETRVARARAYMAKVEGAVEGEGGHNTTFRAACLLVRDFAVDPEEAWPLLVEHNKRCAPPWSDKELQHKLDDADAFSGPRGEKLLEGSGSNGRDLVDAINRKPTDPHRLALRFLASNAKLRFWRGEWWSYTGTCYQSVPETDLKARLNAHSEQVFVEDWRRAVAQAQPLNEDDDDDSAKCPAKLEVTEGLVANVRGALAGLTLLRHSVEAPSWIDPDSGSTEARPFLAVANGLLDVEAHLAGRAEPLHRHNPAWFSPVCLPYCFLPEASCPRWTKALHLSLGGDEELIALLQEWFGYNLLHSTDQQKFMILFGEGGNGKSVVCAALEALLGEENVSHVPLESFGTRFQLIPTVHRLANIVPEIGELDKVAEGHLKAFTSGDRMSFDRKHLTALEVTPTARLTLATNNKPRFFDRSGGIWRRLLLVPFEVVIPQKERVAGMDKIAWWPASGELPGILNWALEGLRRLRANGGFTAAKASAKALEEHKLESNPARAFLLEHCKAEEGARIGKEVLYANYKGWCEVNGHRTLASSTFGTEVSRAFHLVHTGKKIAPLPGPPRKNCYVNLSYDGSHFSTRY
jgi:P4 family phage/plasmid primase-like protien